MITITILTICFLIALSCKIKKVKVPELRVLTWYIHLIFLVLSAICLLLMANDMGFKGTQTERIIFTLYAGSGMILYGFSKPDTDARYAYLLSFFGFPFLLLFGILLPPLRTLTLVITLTLLSDSRFHRYKIDDDYALQTKTSGILAPQPTYSLITDKYWFFEKISSGVIPPTATGNIRLQKINTDSVRISVGGKNYELRIANYE
ncbi:hypothetical protein ECE50_014125 [Chitinophaga sp. Mgbs1]|uniref:Uncharacterized protein n=1 Tax=Chitinophaga solisilvae TaxID=1233460 RepID=A0A433WF33_9BACT|nr:hypothetical protein [Chitinophaga solisilvae]